MTLTLEQAAVYLHMHPTTVQERAKRGMIPGAAKPGKRWVFLEDGLREYLLSLSPCRSTASVRSGISTSVLELRWVQVDLERRRAFLYADQVKTRATLGVPLTDAAVAVLEERRGANKAWVFAHPDSQKPLVKASNKAWYAALRKAKLVGFRWHDLRHTWASWAVMSGVPLRDLMELGGWKSWSMVVRYSHLSTDHLAESAAKIRPISLQTTSQKSKKRHTGG